MAQKERIRVKRALILFKTTTAYAIYKNSGKINPSTTTDLIVLSEDTFKIIPNKLRNMEMFMAIANGKIIYIEEVGIL